MKEIIQVSLFYDPNKPVDTWKGLEEIYGICNHMCLYLGHEILELKISQSKVIALLTLRS